MQGIHFRCYFSGSTQIKEGNLEGEAAPLLGSGGAEGAS